jgi:hypothetical protein
MANFSDFYPYVLPEVVGINEPLADQKILQACIEFCEKTHYWKYVHPAINLVADQKTYTLIVPAESHIVTILDPVYYNGLKIFSRTREWLDINVNEWEVKKNVNAKHYYAISPGVIRPTPYPDANVVGGISEVTIALKPLPNATSVQDFLFDEFFECISHGAKARLFEMKKEKWSDTELAAYNKEKFDDGIWDARVKVKSAYNTDQRYRRSKAHYI